MDSQEKQSFFSKNKSNLKSFGAFVGAVIVIIFIHFSGDILSLLNHTSVERIGSQSDRIEKNALVDEECEAWMEDESIEYSGRDDFKSLCYFEKAVNSQDVRFCLSASHDQSGDCIDYMAAMLNDGEICTTLIPKELESFQSICAIKVAGVNQNDSACAFIEGGGFFERCNEVADLCADDVNSQDDPVCQLEAGTYLSCDLVYASDDRERCETEFTDILTASEISPESD